MWGIKMRLNVCLAALAATIVAATPAVAATTASATAEARGIVLQSLTLNKIDDLDFGTVAADTTAPGTVSIDPDTGVQSVTGGVIAMPGASTLARFDGFASPNVTVQLSMTQPPLGVLCNGTGCANKVGALLKMDKGGPGNRNTGATGAFSVFVGGDFDIAANQAAGLYSAQFDVTAVYP
jgi:Domain of unknown function (DUF4402)